MKLSFLDKYVAIANRSARQEDKKKKKKQLTGKEILQNGILLWRRVASWTFKASGRQWENCCYPDNAEYAASNHGHNQRNDRVTKAAQHTNHRFHIAANAEETDDHS